MTGSPGASERLFSRARQLMPGGVSSPVRAFGSVGGTPRYMSRGEGATSSTKTAASTSTSAWPGAR